MTRHYELSRGLCGAQTLAAPGDEAADQFRALFGQPLSQMHPDEASAITTVTTSLMNDRTPDAAVLARLGFSVQVTEHRG